MQCFILYFVLLFFPRDLKNNTHLVKLKSGGSNGRLTHPKKKKQRKSGLSPEEAFEREYFSKSKNKPSHGVSVCLPTILEIQFFLTSQIVWFDHIGASQIFPLISELTNKSMYQKFHIILLKPGLCSWIWQWLWRGSQPRKMKYHLD